MQNQNLSVDNESVLIPISAAFAPTAEVNLYVEFQVQQGTTILQALHKTGWLTQYPELNTWCQQHKFDIKISQKQWRIGVFSTKKLLTYNLQANDRIEIYRPLNIQPMSKRKKRASKE